MPKRILVVVIFAFVCCLVLLFYWRTTRPSALIQTPQRVYEPSPALSPQDTLMLLEHFNAAVTEREAKLESGIIEFSLTLSKIKALFSKNPVYEERLKWHVTYRFSGQQRFYQIQERVKVKPGWLQRAKWKESKRYKFQADDSGKNGYVNRGDGWRWTSHHPIAFNSYGTPLRWKWDSHRYPLPKGRGLCFLATAVFSESPPSYCRSTLGSQACLFDIDSSIYVSVVV